ncbi:MULTISPECIES: TetR/AcrR family transcriptional regulator [Xanthomonas]|uniref:TetR/AcrR family transcriptional regulator n=1 Tax=Xanthomonas rydalmerensis TaxID=3046274 RepID=A0ABZ0JHE7_9XANT|nr:MULTISPECIES: TetR/AcrR family transcriptional regulator [unclassified Xanthomonas]MBB5877282.1 AcrR family transcriptional regulator [Xanthomonas sp. 3498]MXV06004.1 TetR/AcrR family transcriptional regulator [Xanthomonas sp. LMG 9002]WOS39233.1 TetR/AcrR family transcriptional regulator [Xanthomonas sp. DM-2023]WOS43416.1 TetR/AcrR family transcriptional regulator [Xanthomonas sp. DM-2023]WOS47596.1 TetR/AcrR family transcriptional regulator [Xanthomonas sp. DM-2023]
MPNHPTRPDADRAIKRRLPKQARQRQLLDVAWSIVRSEGSDALTLGYLAERAGVTKPVVYDHFGARNGLLAALYEEYDRRQHALLDEALAACARTLPAVAKVIAASYVDCVMTMGREMPGVSAALTGSPELEALKKEHEALFLDKCRHALAPFAKKPLKPVAMHALLGAAEAVSFAALAGEVHPVDAENEIYDAIQRITLRG